MVALWIVLIVFIVAFFVAAHAIILPKIFLRVRFKISSPVGSGVKVTQDVEGKKILYKTDSAIRKYISGYVIMENGKKKQIVCKVGRNVKYVDYDIVCFNNLDKVIDVITVKEIVGASGNTNATSVPEETAYALIYLNEADGKKFENKTSAKISNLRLAFYLLSCLVVEVLTVFTIRVCCAKLFGGIFGESFLYSTKGTIIACIVCAAVFVLNTVVSVLTVKLKCRNIRG